MFHIPNLDRFLSIGPVEWCPDTVLNDPEVIVDADEDLFQSFHYTNSVATFTATKAHASLGGPIHGSCQAMLMEMIATEKLQHNYEMDSMSIQYLGAPSKWSLQSSGLWPEA